MLANKIILITGGTGSFGTALVDRLLFSELIKNSDVKGISALKEIRILSRDTKKQEEMFFNLKNKLSGISDGSGNYATIRFYQGDIQNKESLTMALIGVDYVFHAAALKEVPYCESFPMEAVNSNIIGTKNLLDSAIEAGVKKVIVISTDKACYPLSAMGISKAMMEKVAIARARSLEETCTSQEGVPVSPGKELSTAICTIRFGNLMGSKGTVIPLFIDQIKAGKELTVTNPDMTRFMMTLGHAVNLAIFALLNGRNGDIVIQKAPAVSLNTLTKALIELYGNGTGSSTVKVTGPRPGEKLYETMATQEEMTKAEDIGDYIRIPATGKPVKELTPPDSISSIEDFNSHNSSRLDVEGMKKLLKQL